MIFLLKPPNWKLFTFLVLACTLITIVLFGKVRNKIRTASLIIENQILHIQPAIFQVIEEGRVTESFQDESIEVFISCFGILLGSRIIKFNQEGVHLKAVDLGGDYLSLTYGKQKKIQVTKFLYEKFSDNELAKIITKFQYETGITPTITFYQGGIHQ